MAKLWEKGIATDALIERFTVGNDREMDLFLAPFDILGSLAHGKMLSEIGLLEISEYALIAKELRSLYTDALEGTFTIEEGVEDIHSQVELELTRRLGDVGKKIHSGRSRNDQVLVDIRLFLRTEIQTIVTAVEKLFILLQELSERHKHALMPGYTHFQAAMPSSFGLWFGAYAESLADDLLLLQAAFRLVNKNPLGSAAGYGSSFPLNRTRTTELLGFQSLNYNVVYAQMTRGKIERITAQAYASVAATLAKMGADICLFVSQNFAFVSFPDSLTTGSSIMPHKKNPDIFELLRARGNRLQALPNTLAMMTTSLPSGYHRDMQLLKEELFPAGRELLDCLATATHALAHIRVHEGLTDDPRYTYIFSVEEVNRRVLEGLSFRDAYRAVSDDINNGRFTAPTSINHTHEGSIGNLCNEQIATFFHNTMSDFGFDTIETTLHTLLEE
jgi:argininosuccinate lyase